jgi:hypothetical protein
MAEAKNKTEKKRKPAKKGGAEKKDAAKKDATKKDATEKDATTKADAAENKDGTGKKESLTMEEALESVGARVDDSAGQRLGKVSGVLVDATSNEPRWLIIRIGRFAGDAAVPSEHTAPVAGRVWVAYERSEVRNSPKLSRSRALSAKQELQLCDHYGIRGGIGRAAEIEELQPDEIRAVPADS